MRDVILCQTGYVFVIYSTNKVDISQNNLFFETVKSKMIISLFETRNYRFRFYQETHYNSLKSLKNSTYQLSLF